jgi:AmpD protein
MTASAWSIDRDGWASPVRAGACDIERIVSPNHDARPAGVEPSLIVVHNISLPPSTFGGRAIDALFTNTLDHAAHPYYEGLVGLRVSSHFLIRRTGEIAQFVPCGMRAWHAGVSSCEGRERCNDFSIGIELEGDDRTAFEAEQYVGLTGLVDALARCYPLTTIAGHSDIAPGRKTDPGPWFDWPRALQSFAKPLRKAVPVAP